MKNKQIGLFDEEDRMKILSKMGDPLEKLNKVIKWEMFREILTVARSKENAKATGRPPFDVVMMFKILVLQKLYNLSDDQTEYQINDRLTFMRFLGLNLGDKIPDSKTIWKFKNDLSEAKAAEKLFSLFDEMIEREGLITHKGSIVDATFVDVPRQRNHRDENKKLKAEKFPRTGKSQKMRIN